MMLQTQSLPSMHLYLRELFQNLMELVAHLVLVRQYSGCFHQLVLCLFHLRRMTKLTLKVSQNFVRTTLKTVTTCHQTASMIQTVREKSLLMRPKFQSISVQYRKAPLFLFSESNTSVMKQRTN